MTKIEPGARIYTVVEVIRGVAVDARNFLRLSPSGQNYGDVLSRPNFSIPSPRCGRGLG